MSSKSLESRINIAKNVAITLIVAIPAIYFVWFFVVNNQTLSIDSSIWGTFGDFVGGILNPIIALFAFYWLTQSVIIQKKELSETQNVLRETEKVQKEQAITQEKKRFEDTFHSLLSQFNIVFETLNQSVIIRETLKKSKIKALHRDIIGFGHNSTVEEQAALMRNKSIECSHYFRILYHLLKFILLNHSFSGTALKFDDAIKSKLTETEKFYSNILRSFLDKEVTQLVAINCIADDASDDFYKFRLLVERYALLEHMRFEPEWLKSVVNKYDVSAFGKHVDLKS